MERGAGLLDRRTDRTKRRGRLTRDETGWTEQEGAFIVHPTHFIVGEGPEKKRPRPFMERPGGFIDRPTARCLASPRDVIAPEGYGEIVGGGQRETIPFARTIERLAP